MLCELSVLCDINDLPLCSRRRAAVHKTDWVCKSRLEGATPSYPHKKILIRFGVVIGHGCSGLEDLAMGELGYFVVGLADMAAVPVLVVGTVAGLIWWAGRCFRRMV